ELGLVPKPRGPRGGIEPMGPQADHLENPTDGPVADELPGANGRFDVQALGVVNGILPTGLGDLLPRGIELLERRERGLVGEKILAVIHGPVAEWPAIAGDRG